MLVPNRHGSSNSYRYGFQGQEKDDELKGEGNSLNYTFRMHDPRVGRFFAEDPLTKSYPWFTPYQFAGNSTIRFIEFEGLEQGDYMYEKTVNEKGEPQLKLVNFVDNGEDAPNRLFVLDTDANKDTPYRYEYNGQFYEMQYIGYSTEFYGEELDKGRIFNDTFDQYEKDVREYLYFTGPDFSDKNFGERFFEVNSQDGTFGDAIDIITRKGSGRVKKPSPNSGIIEDASKIKRFKSSKGLVKEQTLPTKGRLRFIPRAEDVKNGKILKKDGGFVDKFGNIWKKGPSRTKGESFEWDVKLTKEQGKKFKDLGLSRDGKHLNVSQKGIITHK